MDGTVVKAALSGRELARQRRQALAQQGRAALPTLRSAMARRDAAPQQAAAAQGCGCGCGGSGACATTAAEDGVARMLAAAVTPQAAAARPAADDQPRIVTPTGRALAQARRAALAREGKAGLTRVAQATRLATTMPDRDWREALQKGATGRQLAMQRRTLLALTGRAGLAASTQPAASVRPSGRVRHASAAVREAAHTEEGHTLSGQRVSGTQVERSAKVTGMEAGTCRQVTGTEYIGQEQFEAWCATRPQPAPPKVIETHTERGRPVTGSHPGLNPKVTGNETGVCRGITGTRYLAAEDVALCEQVQARAPHKVSVMSSRGDNEVTGTPVGRSPKVTGNEAGAQRPISGTQYAFALQGQAGLRAGTASRRGAPQPAGALQAPAPAVASTDEAQPRQAAAAAETVGRLDAGFALATVSGDSPGTGGGRITGDERGACEPVTGTPYVGPDNLSGGCTLSGRWLTRYPELAHSDAAPPPQTFSITPPARQAQQRAQRITGSAGGDDAGLRVTGPGMKAQGLITGTPEFRHGAATQATWSVPATQAAPAAQRVTGEGAAPQGVRITGDAWGSERRVTGTEGTSAMVRNPTQRGMPRPLGAQARHLRAIERDDVPMSPITGSSGNTPRGAVVTVSGGARG
ncbi:CsoS2 family carboxysome shell protein [Tepidimonas aquatica]|uniref:Carboxysome shell peptide mid-region n=1 Tax=Tepidimonas aquatica TaxID=247482 RepID=A0A554WGK4_9BURK|nr:CsoS2 family carboxysome shell protein [Tepidimonas aquatica]TSE22718.1 Carboxysome shell peptide mid-region [Tepidimonas aquatica]